MISPLRCRFICLSLIAGFLLMVMAPRRADADVCVTIDEARDTFSPQDRAAALLLLARQFELAGEHVVAPGCSTPYVVSHVQFGTTITIVMTGPNGQRDATARGMDDVPAIYSQMIRSLLRGQPMDAPGIVDRTNVANTQAEPPNRVHSDSLFYARLGLGTVFGDRTYSGPSVGMIGYRRELDTFGIDVSFFNFQSQPLVLFRPIRLHYGYLRQHRLVVETRIPPIHCTIGQPDSLRRRRPELEYGQPGQRHHIVQRQRPPGRSHRWIRTGPSKHDSRVRAGRRGPALLQIEFRDLHVSDRAAVPYSTTTEHRWAPAFTLSLGIGWQRGEK